MIRARLLTILLVAGSWYAAAAGAIDIFLRSPEEGVPLFGTVILEVEVLSAAPVVEVRVELDGELVGRLTEQPYRLELQLGEENRQKAIRIEARNTAEETAERRLVIPPLAVDQVVDLGLQQLYVTVTRHGQRLLDLDRESFRVLDDGQQQEIVTFERGDVPLTALLLVDASWSMRGTALATALGGTRAFIAGMRELDQAKVVLFSDRLLAETPLTGDPGLVGEALAEVRAAGGTAINDHLFYALSQLEEQPGRRVLILLSDGIDVESVLDTADLRPLADRTQTLLYWIRTGGKSLRRARNYSAWRNAEQHAAELEALAELVTSSGGKILDIEELDEAQVAFAEILAELRQQYVFGYYPTVDRDDGSWHRVKVLVRPGNAQVRTRAGYFDGRPRARSGRD